MEEKGSSMGIGLMGLAALVCCAGPWLVIGLLPFVLSVWTTPSGQLTIAAVVALLGIAGYWFFFYRRKGSTPVVDCCAVPDKTRKQADYEKG